MMTSLVCFSSTVSAVSSLIEYLAPDRLGKIIKFSADAYVVLEASPTQSTLITLA